MAEVKTPFRNAYLVNQPDLVKTALVDRPDDFPKAEVIRRTLYDLLGDSVFVTNGELWKRQRCMIDPAFAGGRLKEVFPAILDAAETCVARLGPLADGRKVEMEFETSHAAADVIFQTLFSEPINTDDAQAGFPCLPAISAHGAGSQHFGHHECAGLDTASWTQTGTG